LKKDIRQLSVRGDINFQIDGAWKTTLEDGKLVIQDNREWTEKESGSISSAKKKKEVNGTLPLAVHKYPSRIKTRTIANDIKRHVLFTPAAPSRINSNRIPDSKSAEIHWYFINVHFRVFFDHLAWEVGF
jgi:hypothetical protein